MMPRSDSIPTNKSTDSLIVLLQDRSADVRGDAAEALGELGDVRAVRPLVRLLDGDPDSGVRRDAAWALGGIGHPMAVDALIEALQDADDDVREAAASALGSIGDSRAVHPLLDMLQRSRSSEAVRGQAALSLGMIGDPSAKVPLIELLDDPSEDVRWMAVESFGQFLGQADTHVINPLLRILQDRSQCVEIRSQAAVCLGRIGHASVVAPLTIASTDDDADVRECARDALEHIRAGGIPWPKYDDFAEGATDELAALNAPEEQRRPAAGSASMGVHEQVGAHGRWIVPVRDCEIAVSERTAKLLYLSDEDPRRVSNGVGVTMTFDLTDGTARSSSLSSQEPSTIYLRMSVRKPRNTAQVPSPDYYPTYAGLTAEQKWMYLNWLRQVSEPVYIGYVFIYYYGLERQLVEGEFDLAFDEILQLRQYHKHGSFMGYSGSALLSSCLLRQRLDRLDDLSRSGEPPDLKNAGLLVEHLLGHDLTAKNLIEASSLMYGLNRKYLRSEPELFESCLAECLRLKYGGAYFPFANRYKLSDLPRSQELMFANVSFPSEIRTPDLPCFLEYPAFTDAVRALFAETHERVKASLRDSRKRKE